MVEIIVDGRRARIIGGLWRGDPMITALATSAMAGFQFEAQMGDAELLAARHVATALGGRIMRMSRPREPVDRRAIQ